MRLGPQSSSLLILSGLILWSTALGYHLPSPSRRQNQQQHQQLKHESHGYTMDRSTWIRQVALIGLSITPASILPTRALAVSSDTTTVVASIQDATQTLQTLLDNWEKAVIDCTFADIPRELLESKNKEQLLEKAKVSALFDKSASIVTCKTVNRRVRDYIGATGKGPMVGLEKNLRNALDLVDPDNVDVYVQGIEDVQQSLSRAKSLSYMSGVADFNSVNNFKQDDIKRVLSSDSNLEQARGAIQLTVKGLNEILALLPQS
jgi:hypothetical protein